MQSYAKLAAVLSLFSTIYSFSFQPCYSADESLSTIRIRKAERIGNKILLSDGLSYKYLLSYQVGPIKLTSCSDDILAISTPENGKSAQLIRCDNRFYVQITSDDAQFKVEIPKVIQENLKTQSIKAIYYNAGSILIVSNMTIFEFKNKRWIDLWFGKKLSHSTNPIGIIDQNLYFLSSRGEYRMVLEVLNLGNKKWKCIFAREVSEYQGACRTKNTICILLGNEIITISHNRRVTRLDLPEPVAQCNRISSYGEYGIALLNTHAVFESDTLPFGKLPQVHFEKLVDLAPIQENDVCNLLHASPQVVLVTDSNGFKVLDVKSGRQVTPIVTAE